eukprot:2823096-Amphidinium_carterae.1
MRIPFSQSQWKWHGSNGSFSSSDYKSTAVMVRLHWQICARLASWNEHVPVYWTGVFDKATAAYSRYCPMSAAEKA